MLVGGLIVIAGSLGGIWAIYAHNEVVLLGATAATVLGAILTISAMRRARISN
jgi:hypothetical protein